MHLGLNHSNKSYFLATCPQPVNQYATQIYLENFTLPKIMRKIGSFRGWEGGRNTHPMVREFGRI